jgi:hypothetical protein
MKRLKWLVVIGALLLVLGVIEAGPAAGATGGNNDAAKACQRGGWQSLFARTGEAYKNQGDCVNDGAQANPPFGTNGKAACDAIPGQLGLLHRLVTVGYAADAAGVVMIAS